MKKTIGLMVASLLATVVAETADFSVDCDVPAGNVIVKSVVDNVVTLSPDLRDTTGDWFYWAFRVQGAAGRTVTFNFTSSYVGVRGPVVSLDKGETWSYPLDGVSGQSSFTYTFPADADEVWFYECHPYHQSHWEAFLAQHEAKRGTYFETGVLCQSKKGRDVEKARFGCLTNPKYTMLITSRHHASETIATYALEGFLDAVLADDELGAWLRENVEVMVVPFIDKDGCVDGDQGKNRSPHDHNRDYTEFIYAETKAVVEWIKTQTDDQLDVWIDFHCPWIRGDYNEFVYSPHKKDVNNRNGIAALTFDAILEKLQCGSLNYKASDDLPYGEAWNTGGNYEKGWSSINWAINTLPVIKLGHTFEIPFANANGAVVTPEKVRDFGRDVAKTLRAFLEESVDVDVTLPKQDLYFSTADSAFKYWDYADGWKKLDGTVWGRVPTLADDLTFNSTHLNVAAGKTPMEITNGVDAVCNTFKIATSNKGDGSSYADDGRVIGVRISGGSLTTGFMNDGSSACIIGDNAAGYGALEMTGGELNTYRMLVAREGIGVLTNAGGRINMIVSGSWDDPLFVVGNSAGSKGMFTMSDGLIATTNESLNKHAQVWIGNRGEGHFDFTGGIISNRIVVGKSTGGHGTMNMAGGTLTSSLEIGNDANATGVVTVTKGQLTTTMTVGVSGHGTLTITGEVNRTSGNTIQVARLAGSTGRVFIKDTENGLSQGYGSSSTLYAGLRGTADVEVSGQMAFDYLKIGAKNAAYSTVRILEGAILAIDEQVSVAGSAIPGDVFGESGTVYTEGRGEICLEGGTLKFINSDYSKVNFYIGRYTEKYPGTFGVIRGWGKIAPAEAGKTNVRMAMGDGQIIADGMGEERTLDFNEVVSITNLVANDVSTTNGWYAVNKGCVLFPRTWFGKTTEEITRCFGAYGKGARPDYVNSVMLTMRNTKDQNHIRGGVFAPDRADVHVDALPPHDTIVGIWKLGDFTSVNGTGKTGFSSVDLTFRYDHTRVEENHALTLYRWNDSTSKWERLVGGAPASDHLISAKGLAAQSVDGYNIGLFALVTHEPGMIFLVR